MAQWSVVYGVPLPFLLSIPAHEVELMTECVELYGWRGEGSNKPKDATGLD